MVVVVASHPAEALAHQAVQALALAQASRIARLAGQHLARHLGLAALQLPLLHEGMLVAAMAMVVICTVAWAWGTDTATA